MNLSKQQIAHLKSYGLLVSGPDESGCRYTVGKPISVEGNVRVLSYAMWKDDTPLDGPFVDIIIEDDTIAVQVRLTVPGPGPGDFRNIYTEVDAAVDDVIDFFFGDPERIRAFGMREYDSIATIKERIIQKSEQISFQVDGSLEKLEEIKELLDFLWFEETLHEVTSIICSIIHGTESFPVGGARKFWNEEALEKKDQEKKEYELRNWDKMKSVAMILIEKLG